MREDSMLPWDGSRPVRVRIGGVGSRSWRWMIPDDNTMYETKAKAWKALDDRRAQQPEGANNE